MNQKSILIGFLLFIFSASIYSQKVEGIGKFKINQTTISVISELELERKTKQSELKENPDYSPSIDEQGVYWLKPDTTLTSEYSDDFYGSYCKESKTYFMKKYSISDINLEDVYLTFLKDTLIEVRADILSEYDKVQEVVKLKYGLPDKTAYLPGYYIQLNKYKRKGLKISKADMNQLKEMYLEGNYWNNQSTLLYVGNGMKFFQFTKGKFQDVAVNFCIVVRDTRKINYIISCSESLRKSYQDKAKFKLKDTHKDF
jgi:hypothetical protein